MMHCATAAAIFTSFDVKILSKEDVTPEICKWVRLKRTVYEDVQGRRVVWESVERTTKVAEVDGAGVVAMAVSSGAPPKVVVIAQYRAPLQKVVLEVPAGLADEGESMEQVAVRELHEETGFTAAAVDVSPATANEPSTTNSSLKVVLAEVDLDSPCNQGVQPAQEAGEAIEVFLLPLEQLHATLVSLAQQRGWMIDSRLYMLALGIKLGLAVKNQA